MLKLQHPNRETFDTPILMTLIELHIFYLNGPKTTKATALKFSESWNKSIIFDYLKIYDDCFFNFS